MLTSLEQAVNMPGTKNIIILTHIPPFKESCLHNGIISNNDWLPYFSSKATGDILIDIAIKNPSIEFLTYCGHTHSSGFYQPLKNLTIKAGGAEYYKPEIQLINC